MINGGLATLTQDRIRLRELVAATRVALEEMEESLDRVEAAMRMHEACSSPIRLLPDDILLSIFGLCTPAWGSLLGNTASLNTLAFPPWVLSQVCRRWRALAVSESALWSVVQLGILRMPVSSQCFLLGVMNQRAGQRHLAIRTDSSWHTIHPSFILRLRDVQHNIGHLSVSSLLPFKGFSLVNLQYLRLQNPRRQDRMVDSLNLQSLQTLEYCGAEADHFYPPWKQLKYVNLEKYSMEILDLLVDSAVEVLRLAGAVTAARRTLESDSTPTSALLPALHTLWISGCWAELQCILNRIRAPQMKRLSLERHGYEYDSRTWNLPESGDKARIEHLEIAFDKLDIQDLVSQFQSMCNIRILYIELDSGDLNKLCSLLCVSGNILPRLRLLRLAGNGYLSYGVSGLVEMISARQSLPDIGRLDEVQIMLAERLSKDTHLALDINKVVGRLRQSIGAHTKVSLLLSPKDSVHFERVPEFWD